MTDLTYYLVSGVLIIGVLAGIAFQSKVKTAVRGNQLAALSVAAAIVVTLMRYELLDNLLLWVTMALTLVLGLILASQVKMIQMPQIVAMLNGFGGVASAIVGALVIATAADIFVSVTAVLAIAVGLATLSGSLIAAGKLHHLLPQRGITLPAHQLLTGLWLLLVVGGVVVVGFAAGSILFLSSVVAAVAATLFGFFLAIRVGGADMPITIALLNSLSGVAGAIAGMAIADPFLVAVGGVVGSAGLILTQVMCRAMNRSLVDILLGKTSVGNKKLANMIRVENIRADSVAQILASKPSESISEQAKSTDTDVVKNTDIVSTYEGAAALLQAAKKIMIVPGYGMALSQAQAEVKQLSDRLTDQGSEVKFAIHPVAGRMPGHMNVLLAEVDVDYEDLLEMDEANPEFSTTDVVLIVGANDVVNPAANTATDTPIYGMPILKANEATNIIICNFDREPGYAGVPNSLYSQGNVIMLLGDAKETLNELLKLLV